MISSLKRYSKHFGVVVAAVAVLAFIGGVVWPMYLTQREILQTLRSSPAMKAKSNAIDIQQLSELDVREFPQRGELNAKVVLVELLDYQCPFCQRHVRETSPAILDEYVKTGKIRVAFVDTPLGGVHPLAMPAAQASHCAGDQGAYWRMHDNLFAEPIQTFGDIIKAANATALNMPRFDECLGSKKYADTVMSRRTPFTRAGIMSTPFFLIGIQKGRSATISIKSVIRGAEPLQIFRTQLDEALRGATL